MPKTVNLDNQLRNDIDNLIEKKQNFYETAELLASDSS